MSIYDRLLSLKRRAFETRWGLKITTGWASLEKAPLARCETNVEISIV